jgi:hypothetical protein
VKRGCVLCCDNIVEGNSDFQGSPTHILSYIVLASVLTTRTLTHHIIQAKEVHEEHKEENVIRKRFNGATCLV